MVPPETTRRLATILAADVVGYSRLMAEDEEATVRTLRAHREIIDRLIARHEGRIFHTAGDSVIAEFGSAVEAVRCATTIQDELRVRNAELPEDRRMLLRIGINIGDVIVDGDNLLGDGVNVAARLEGIAQPGGVCISGGTFDQVKNKLSIGFEDLGPQAVKNIPEPVAAFRITGAPGTVSAATPAAPERRTSTGAMLAGAVVVSIAVAAIWLLRPEPPPPTDPVASPSRAAPPTEPAAPVTPVVDPPTPAPEVATPSSEPSSPPATAPPPEPAPPQPPSQPETVTRVAPPSSVASAPIEPSPAPMQTVPAEEIVALVSGSTIHGTRRGDGRPFTIDLLEGGRGLYSEPRGGTESGTTRRTCGTWRVEDGQFCMQFRGFNKGQEACPTLLRQGVEISAQRPDGEALDWAFSHDPAQASRISRDPSSTTSNDLCADEITALVNGRQITGRNKKNRPFTIGLEAGGVAKLSVIRPGDRPPFEETGRWWTEDYRFCMRFATFGQGQDLCPRFLAAEGERIAMSKGDGTPLDWTLNR